MKPILRRPTVEDGPAIRALADRAGALDVNTPYAYLLLSWHFAGTAVLAELDGEVVGFVVGYRPPTDPDAVFVWQVAVDERQRGRGLGQALLDAFVATAGGHDARWLEATVTPGNAASWRLFRGFADRHGVPIEEEEALAAPLFPDGHEAEHLVRIGPLAPRAARPELLFPIERTN